MLLAAAGCGRVEFADATVAGAHVPEDIPWRGRGELSLGDGLDGVIDTSALSINGGPATVGWFGVVPSATGGPELAVLQVDRFELHDGATLRIVGDRPLVVLAALDITIAGVLDASASGTTPGPGASQAGRGENGMRVETVCDGGGGGGGHASPGGAGGGASCGPAAGGRGGDALGDPTISVLEGGGAGGPASQGKCPSYDGYGAGGGAIQLTARDRVSITVGGGIRAAGAGGLGGLTCTGSGDAAAGGGGGAGGAIYIEADTIEIAGTLAANGGGGGAGGNGDPQNGTVGDGGPGADGELSDRAAIGGAPPAPNAGIGGAGGALAAAGSGGSTVHNGGGGGGAPGRIVIGSPNVRITGVVSPPAVVVP